MSGRRKDLKDMTRLELLDEIYNRRASFQRAMSCLVDGADPVSAEMVSFTQVVRNLNTDLRSMLPVEAKQPGYVVIVTDKDDMSFDVRAFVRTLAAGKSFIELEVKETLPWTDEFGGTVASKGRLCYEVRPTKDLT